ncbi:uncharacterized protein MELLADRAFT_102290 [Melampsora larici-populina 98AG31]|uniref:Secreted protein n=1 Tax=Melampsora larici-populina (strain 98AG31 / pathotype 3-4-7) TaxID=747676 RepID=F4R7T4_MELLP|nr:uncharacterized protein MELLADRAFT_102290 [Melampsora larici-populina 98AG31]EGG11370.1 secreted protein [Melampsora larici-populina 98AG31]
MSRILSHLFISLTILLISLILAGLGVEGFSLANSCTVCQYDGTAYNASSATETATDLCINVRSDMGVACVNRGWYTHFRDHKHGGQKTYCRLKCQNPNTPCSSHLTEPPNPPSQKGPHESLIGGVHMPCNQWPIS